MQVHEVLSHTSPMCVESASRDSPHVQVFEWKAIQATGAGTGNRKQGNPKQGNPILSTAVQARKQNSNKADKGMGKRLCDKIAPMQVDISHICLSHMCSLSALAWTEQLEQKATGCSQKRRCEQKSIGLHVHVMQVRGYLLNPNWSLTVHCSALCKSIEETRTEEHYTWVNTCPATVENTSILYPFMLNLDGDGGGMLQLLPLKFVKLTDQRISGWALLNEAWIRQAR